MSKLDELKVCRVCKNKPIHMMGNEATGCPDIIQCARCDIEINAGSYTPFSSATKWNTLMDVDEASLPDSEGRVIVKVIDDMSKLKELEAIYVAAKAATADAMTAAGDLATAAADANEVADAIYINAIKAKHAAKKELERCQNLMN